MHSLQHSPDGESRRQSGGKVFQWVNDQVDPVGHTGTQSFVHAPLVSHGIYNAAFQWCVHFTSLGQLQNRATCYIWGGNQRLPSARILREKCEHGLITAFYSKSHISLRLFCHKERLWLHISNWQIQCTSLSKWTPVRETLTAWRPLVEQWCGAGVVSATDDTGNTHSFLSRAFSNSLVNKLFSPICIQKKKHTGIFLLR